MTYSIAISKLANSLKSCGFDNAIEYHDIVHFIKIAFQCLANDISQGGYPKSFYLKCNPNGFSFYGLYELLNSQDIYEFDNENFLLIADSSSDPVILSSDCCIYWSRYGMDHWDFQKIANNMQQFFTMLDIFIKDYLIRFKSDIKQDEYKAIDLHFQSIKSSLMVGGVDEIIADKFLKCLFYL